ncbi:hypothetical protein RI367_004353 [Sorochytrium milnesiophthora]
MLQEQSDRRIVSPEPGVLIHTKQSASGSLSRATFKSKITSYYDTILNSVDRDELQAAIPWGDFFMLKPNAEYFERFFGEKYNADLMSFSFGIRYLASKCVRYGKTASEARKLNCYKTLQIILQNIVGRRFSNWAMEIAELLCGFKNMDIFFNSLLQLAMDDLMVDSVEVRSAAVDMLFTIAGANVANVNANPFNEYLLIYDVYDLLLQVIRDPQFVSIAPKTLSLVTVLAQYRRNESPNAYVHRLHTQIDVSIYRSMAALLARDLRIARNAYLLPGAAKLADDDDAAFSLGTAVSGFMSLFMSSSSSSSSAPSLDTSEDPRDFSQLPPANAAVSLSCLELIEGASHFITTLVSLLSQETVQAPVTLDEDLATPHTFIGDLISLCSYTFQNSKTTRSHVYAGLLMRTLRSLTMHSAFCSFAANAKFPHKRSPRVSKLPDDMPVMAYVLDSVIGYLRHNLRRKLAMHTYICALEIVYTCIAHLRKGRTRIAYHWGEMWKTLLSVLSFVVSRFERLGQIGPTVQVLTDRLLVCLNTAIVHGDDFLPDGQSNEALYYELVRQSDMFDELERRYPSPRHHVVRLAQRNIRTVLSQFKGALAAPTTATGSRPKRLSSKQIMTLIKEAYIGLDLSGETSTLEFRSSRMAHHDNQSSTDVDYTHPDPTMVRTCLAEFKVLYNL